MTDRAATGEPGLDEPRQWSGGWEPRCDDDFYCGECPDCLSGEHPENRPRRADDKGADPTP
jgi:hypothetical protein